MKQFSIFIFFVLLLSCQKAPSPAPVEKPITVDFTINNNNCVAPCTISFTNSSENAFTNSWNFGDNTNSGEENPEHVYQFPGEYTATLTARNEEGDEASVSKQVTIEQEFEFITGMDLSYQSFLEPFNVKYYQENGDVIDNLFQYVQDNGVNLIRIRLFHTPDENNPVIVGSSLANVMDLCKKIKTSNNKILLDIHYSDTWADPGHQTLPVAWQGISFENLQDSVYQYTKSILEQLHAQNTLPEMVQIGNETNSGFLWDHGKVWNEFANNWGNLAKLLNSANQAILEVESQAEENIQTLIHFAGVVNAKGFFEKLGEHFTDFDIIGLSHYHLYHSKDLQEVQSALNDLAITSNKPILITETSYPWTLQWNDWTHNVVGLEDQLINGYLANPEDQKAFYEKMVEILKNIPNDKGIGFVWWAPDMVAFNGPQSNEGSSRENLTTFDFDNKVLPVMDVFRDY